MNEVVKLFKRKWLIEGHQLTQGCQVHTQQLPIAKMGAQHNDSLPRL